METHKWKRDLSGFHSKIFGTGLCWGVRGCDDGRQYDNPQKHPRSVDSAG